VLLLLACAGSPVDSSLDSDPTRDSSSDSTSDSSADSAADSARDSAAPDTAPDSADSGRDTATPPVPQGGPCAAYAAPVAMGEVQDPALDELSGLAGSRLNPGILWTHEDSAGAAELYALDAEGNTVATLTLEGAENVDWEDLALGTCGETWCIYLGDIGDLGTDRAEFAVLVVEEPLLGGETALTATPERRPFVYPGDPEDAEALVVDASGTPLVITKRPDATAGIYRLPRGETTLELVSEIATGAAGEDLTARATAADLWLDPPRLLVRTYLHLWEYGFDDPTAPTGPDARDFTLEIQGESVAWDPIQGGYWTVSEGSGPTLHYVGCDG
jgi:hypothetical protein